MSKFEEDNFWKAIDELNIAKGKLLRSQGTEVKLKYEVMELIKSAIKKLKKMKVENAS